MTQTNFAYSTGSGQNGDSSRGSVSLLQLLDAGMPTQSLD